MQGHDVALLELKVRKVLTNEGGDPAMDHLAAIASFGSRERAADLL